MIILNMAKEPGRSIVKLNATLLTWAISLRIMGVSCECCYLHVNYRAEAPPNPAVACCIGHCTHLQNH